MSRPLFQPQRCTPRLGGGASMLFDREPSGIAVQAIDLIAARDAAGQAKYGTSMDRRDLRPGAWLQHAIEEHADALQYQLALKAGLESLVRQAYQAGMHAEGMHDRTKATEDAIVRELLG